MRDSARHRSFLKGWRHADEENIQGRAANHSRWAALIHCTAVPAAESSYSKTHLNLHLSTSGHT